MKGKCSVDRILTCSALTMLTKLNIHVDISTRVVYIDRIACWQTTLLCSGSERCHRAVNRSLSGEYLVKSTVMAGFF